MTRFGRRLASCLAVGIALACAHSAAAQPHGEATSLVTAQRPLTADDWREDLYFLHQQLPLVHKNLFHTMTRAEFDSAVAKLDADIPGLDSMQVVVRLMQLCALIQDGHSGVSQHDSEREGPRIPVRFDRYPDGVYVRAAAPEYASIVGGKVLSVGSVDIQEALRRADSVVPHDRGNPGMQFAWATTLVFSNPGVMHGLGLAGTDGTAEFRIERNGRAQTVRLRTSTDIPAWWTPKIPAGWVDARPASAPMPLSVPHADRPQWFIHLPEHRAVYFQFNGVQDGDSLTLAGFARQLGEFIECHPVDRLVIDLRNNGGGNNTLLRPLLTMLIGSKVNHRGGLYAIIGPRTFSAAQNFVNRLSNYTDVIFLGAPTGENVNLYGDAKRFELPHSRLLVAASGLWWQDMDPRDTRTAMFPEIAAENAFTDYVAGRDRVLDAALTGSAPPALEAWLEPALAMGSDSVRARYDTWKSDPARRCTSDPESRLNNYGYTLLAARRVPEALTLFRVIADTHPASANAFDSLGEALVAAGDTAAGIAAYRRSVELNPKNQGGRQALERLEARTHR